jgi:HNH endonuclease/NUMOD4 motif
MPEKDFTTEIWKPVVGYEGFYDVSNFGRVRSYHTFNHVSGVGVSDKPQRFLRRHLDCGDYPCVVLYAPGTRKKEFKVHALVASAFIGPCPPDRVVGHKDNNKSNNRVENLEYITQSQNIHDAVASGIWHSFKGEEHGMAKLTDNDVRQIRFLRTQFITVRKRVRMPVRKIAKKFHVSTSTIENVLARKNWSHVK